MEKSPTIDVDVARRCIVDFTTALRRRRDGVDGMRRVELETARALQAVGGRVAVIGKGSTQLRLVSPNALSVLLDKTRRGPAGDTWSMGPVRKAAAAVTDRLQVFPALEPQPGDVLLLFGEYWTPRLLDGIRAIHRSGAMRIVPLVHDLMPIRRPELFWDDRPGCDTGRFLGVYRQSVRTFVEVSDLILTNSEFSRSDLLRFCEEQGWASPPIAVVPLASDLDHAVTPRLTPRLRDLDVGEGGFALMVAHFDPRKNHLFAYQLWRRLSEKLGSRTMPLVLAGRRGWQSADLFVRLEHDPEMWGRHLRLVEGPSDEELAWLYSRAAFTVFPSELEGWGLPITESLSFGAPCLAADNSSLREASQGLAWHADTFDGSAWMQEVERCMLDPAHLAAARSAIRAKFIKRRWGDFLVDVLKEAGSASNARELAAT